MSGQQTTVMLIILSFGFTFMTQTWFDFILFGMPWSFFMVIATNYGCNLILFVTCYFNLFCYCLSLRMRELNAKLRRIAPLDLKEHLIRINAQLGVISDCNAQYWSKVVTWNVIGFSAVNLFVLYQAMFSHVGMFINLAYAWITLITFIIVSILILSAFSVNVRLNQTYKSLNHINADCEMRSILIQLKAS
jgi:hypothetical protein